MKKCLVFDAIAACRIRTVERLARSEPATPASHVAHRDEVTILNIYITDGQRNKRKPRTPPDPEPTIEAFAINTARVAGFIPSKRQPRPGTQKLWHRYSILLHFVENQRIMRDLELSRQCLRRRIPDRDTMLRETAAWVERRNAADVTVDWRFTTKDARTKLKSLYPSIQ